MRVNCRPKTIEAFEPIIQLYIVPELGYLDIADVGRAHVSALHHKLQDKPTQANQTVKVLARMFRLAEAWGMTPPRRNPCRSIRRYRERPRARFLTPAEYRRLGRVDEHVAVRCKPKTAALYNLVVDRHLLPKLGRVPAAAVDHATVTELH